jgi:hypothetical protein
MLRIYVYARGGYMSHHVFVFAFSKYHINYRISKKGFMIEKNTRAPRNIKTTNTSNTPSLTPTPGTRDRDLKNSTPDNKQQIYICI